LYIVDPASTAEHVIQYRSFAGWFGVTGLMHLANYGQFAQTYARVFEAALTVTLAALAAHAWRREMTDRAILAWTTALLVAIPALGPGYASQYLSWSLPLLVLLFGVGSPLLRASIALFAGVVLATDLVEYAFIESHGMFFIRVDPTPWALRWSAALGRQSAQTVLRLPLFVSYLALLAGLAVEIRAASSTKSRAVRIR
jgi:hypothetical protein